jgi:flagellar biosynthesis protein FlhA
VWIGEPDRQRAEMARYTVVPPTSVIATHLTEIIKRHADELLTRQEVSRLLDTLRERSPKLVEELIPNVLKPDELQNVLQHLLRERVPIRDLEAILETMGDWIGRTRDPDILTEYVRHALARTICHLHRNEQGRINCLTLDPQIEELIAGNIRTADGRSALGLAPALQTRIVAAIRSKVEEILPACRGQSPVVLCSPQVRLWVRRMIEGTPGALAVLSYNEIVRDVEVEARGMVVLNEQSPNVPG